MTVQIINYGACIRLVTDNSVLMLAKSQIVNIEVIRDDTVKINIGEGPLKEVLIKLVEVTQPAGLLDVAALRDSITHMLDYSNLFEMEAVQKQQAQIDELIAIKQLFTLWHSSLLTDLNFQQLQVNNLVALNNRFIETKEDNQAILNNQRDQTVELRTHTGTLTVIKSIAEIIQGLNSTALEKLLTISDKISQTNENTAKIATIEELQRTALIAELQLLTNIQDKLKDIFEQDTDVLAKVTNLDAIQTLQTNSLAKLETIANALATSDTRMLAVIARLDSIVQTLGNLTVTIKP